jgi:5-methylcytosine-specific restriction endonuclease McrA
MQSLAELLRVLTHKDNADARKALSRFLPSARQPFAHGFSEALTRLGLSRESFEAETGAIATIRYLWEIVPENLFSHVDPDFEWLADQACEHHKLDMTREQRRELHVVFKRLRSSSRKQFRKTSLSFERSDHVKLLENQYGRCAVCGFLFPEFFRDFRYDLEDDFINEFKHVARESEVALPSYFRQPELDHIIPFFLGGDGPENWQILCKSCNLGKGESLSWMSRRGWMPTLRVSELTTLSASLRFGCLAQNEATFLDHHVPDTSFQWRLFKKRNNGLITGSNLEARFC